MGATGCQVGKETVLQAPQFWRLQTKSRWTTDNDACCLSMVTVRLSTGIRSRS